uniref:Interleukin-1 receptor antagonist protein n=1 Tax=Strigops habroptila TaxID=2489341 RepID=A0A672UKY8_STRHB
MEALFEEFLGKGSPRGRPHHFVLRDTEQRGLCLRGGRLVPTPLQGASADQEEPISVVPNPRLERRRCPLIVGIRGGSRALSCSPGPEPRLQLEDVGLLELFSRGEGATPCTFYKTFGGSTHTFEAAACPGAFLSASSPSPSFLFLFPPLVPPPPGSSSSFHLPPP